MEQYNLTMPRAVFSGKNALNRLKELVADTKLVAVITDNGVLATGLVDLVLERLKQIDVDYIICSDLPPEPAYFQVQQLVNQLKSTETDFIVAVGGGSVMDAAKLASLLIASDYTVKDLLDTPSLGVKTVPTCLIPTTAGTGSEATPNAIVAVPEKQLKVGIVNSNMIPDTVILDSDMIRNLPRSIAAATGVDAMAHAIECYTSNKANPFSDFFALEAFDLILNNIEAACDSPDAHEEKNRMQLAAFYAGVAIACSGTTAVHALSYPLGGKYHIAHGVSNAMLLMPVMKFNESYIQEKLAKVYNRVVHGEKACGTTEEKSAWVIRRMGQIVHHLGIPSDLSTFHVSRNDLEDLVAAGMQVTRLLNNNMKPVTAEDARSIYLQILL